jgi:hypothetical protein
MFPSRKLCEIPTKPVAFAPDASDPELKVVIVSEGSCEEGGIAATVAADTVLLAALLAAALMAGKEFGDCGEIRNDDKD